MVLGRTKADQFVGLDVQKRGEMVLACDGDFSCWRCRCRTERFARPNRCRRLLMLRHEPGGLCGPYRRAAPGAWWHHRVDAIADALRVSASSRGSNRADLPHKPLCRGWGCRKTPAASQRYDPLGCSEHTAATGQKKRRHHCVNNEGAAVVLCNAGQRRVPGSGRMQGRGCCHPSVEVKALAGILSGPKRERLNLGHRCCLGSRFTKQGSCQCWPDWQGVRFV